MRSARPGKPEQTGNGETGKQETSKAKVASPEPDAQVPPDADLGYWQRKARYPDVLVASLAVVVAGEPELDALTPGQLSELTLLVEFAARGKVSTRTLEGWLTQLAEGGDREAAVSQLRERLRQKANEVELVGRREAA